MPTTFPTAPVISLTRLAGSVVTLILTATAVSVAASSVVAPAAAAVVATESVRAAESSVAVELPASLELALDEVLGAKPSSKRTSHTSFARPDGRWTVSVQLRGEGPEQQHESAENLLAWGATLPGELPLESGGRFGSALEIWIDPVFVRDLSERR